MRIFLLKLGVHAQTEIGGIADLERGGRLEERARQKETEEGDEPRGHEGRERGPGKAPARLIDLVVFGSDRSHARGRGCSRSSDGGGADVGVRTFATTQRLLPPRADRRQGEVPRRLAWPPAAATAAAAGASAAAGSPSSAATSASVRAGKLLRPRRACSAAMVDLLHFFPSATHLATSALMGPLAALPPSRRWRAAAGVGAAAAAAGALASTGSPSRADISALFSGGKPLRPRRACSAAMVDLLHLFPCATHLATSSLMLPAAAAGGAAGGSRLQQELPQLAAGALAGAAGAAAPPTSHGMGWPALSASMSASVSSVKSLALTIGLLHADDGVVECRSRQGR